MKTALIVIVLALATATAAPAETLANFNGRSAVPNISGLLNGGRQHFRRPAPLPRSMQHTFRTGFEEGYRIIKGDVVVLPLIPLQPVTPYGSTAYREGIKAGIKKAVTGR